MKIPNRDQALERLSKIGSVKLRQPAFHLHSTESGLLVKCYHSSKNTLLSISFWLGMTMGFPFEHFL